MLAHPETDAFEARGLDIEIADKLGASFQRGQWIFEYRDQGESRYRKIRRAVDREWRIDPTGQRLQFWNLDQLRDLPYRPGDPLVITEGEFDCIAVAQTCGGFVISVPNGAPGKRSEGAILVAEDTAYSYLWSPAQKLIAELAQFDKIILATDGDAKGQLLRDELAIRIGEPRCWYVTYPAGCKDANDCLIHHGADALRRLIADAKPLRPGYLLKPSDIPPRALTVTYSSGWECLDKHLRLERPELLVIAGQPGHGKTQFVRALIFHLAESHGLKAAFSTPEDKPHRLKRDMRRFALRAKPYANQDQQRQADEWMDVHFRVSTPPRDEPITMTTLLAEMESAALHHDCQVMCVDPWNEVSHDRGRLSESEYIGEALVTLKRIAQRLGMILIIVAHPTKLADGTKATLYDISGSAHWRNKADHGIIIHRPDLRSQVTEVHIEKSKDHEELGVPGVVGMRFDSMKADYLPVPKPEGEAA